MKVLVVGAGGREHALCWAIADSPRCDTLYCAPGNAGIAAVAQCVDIAANNLDGLIAFNQENNVDFVVVGPEDPLVAGLVDRLDDIGIKSFGPRASAAILEGSKGFMKEFCGRHGIPTAAYQHFTQAAQARDYVKSRGAPIVIKADGLAAGKGVVVALTQSDAELALHDMLGAHAFGQSLAEAFMVNGIFIGALPVYEIEEPLRIAHVLEAPHDSRMNAYGVVEPQDNALSILRFRVLPENLEFALPHHEHLLVPVIVERRPVSGRRHGDPAAKIPARQRRPRGRPGHVADIAVDGPVVPLPS